MTLAFIDVPAAATLAATHQRIHQAVLGRAGRGALDDDARAGRPAV